jgi:hypothetical protein
MRGSMAANVARVQAMFRCESAGSAHWERISMSYCSARWAKAVAFDATLAAAPPMCCRPIPLNGEGIGDRWSSRVVIASRRR